jgi:hypothetical protein
MHFQHFYFQKEIFLWELKKTVTLVGSILIADY